MAGGPDQAVQWSAIHQVMEARRWPEAAGLLERWLARTPEDGRAWLLLGTVRDAQGRPEEALAALRRVAEGDPGWPLAQSTMGEVALRRGDAAGAERAFRRAADRDPNAVDPRRRLVYLLSLQWRIGEAQAMLWELYRLTDDPRHLNSLGELLDVMRTDGLGLGADLEKFLARDPGNPWLRRAEGLDLLRRGLPAEARPHLAAAAEALDDDPDGRLALAECLLLLGESGGVEAALGAEPRLPSERARWWLIRGEWEQARGASEAAHACWRRATEIDPMNSTAWYRVGQDLARRGEADAAREVLARAEAIRGRIQLLLRLFDTLLHMPPDAAAYERAAELCREAGRIEEARAWYLQTIRLDPTRATAQAALARLPAATPEVLATIPRLRPHAEVAVQPESRRSAAGPVLDLVDVASGVGMGFRYDYGTAGGRPSLVDTMGGGLGLIDYDEDGRLDVYFVNGCPLPFDPSSPPAPNRLFRNRGDGTFEDATRRAGVGGLGYGMGCAVGDYDGDGHDDLFVTGWRRTVLYRNRGDGTFEDVTERAGVGSDRWTTAAGFADLDADGDLDLVAVTYVAVDPAHEPECRDHTGRLMRCEPGRFLAQADHLFRNDGNGTFTDVTREAGLDAPEGLGLGLAIADLDDDGRLDLYVANDGAPDFLFRNRGGLRFEEVGALAGVAYDGSGRATASMGVVADDLDGDGRIDLFHTNFLNEPNTLLANQGDGLFQDRAVVAGLDAPSRPVTGFGTAALDVDNDGYLDLFVANGHVDDQPWLNNPMAQLPHLFLARGDGRFTPVPPAAVAYLGRPVVGRGVAAGDLDNDGRVDLVVVHRDRPAALLHNATAGGHWLSLRLHGRCAPIGARATVRVGGRTLVRWRTSGTSYLAASDPRLHFGLGAARTVEQLEVRWPSGRVQVWSDLPADRLYDLREGGEPTPRSGSPPGGSPPSS